MTTRNRLASIGQIRLATPRHLTMLAIGRALLGLAIGAVTIRADAGNIREWVGGVGNYGTSSNWIPPETPGPGDIALINAAGSHPTANGSFTVQNLQLQTSTSFSIASGHTFTTETACSLLDSTFDIEPQGIFDGAFTINHADALVQIDGTWLVPSSPITTLDGGTFQGFGVADARDGWIDVEFDADVDVVMPFSPFMLGHTRIKEEAIFTVSASQVVDGDPAVDAVLGPLSFSGGILDVQTPDAWRLGGTVDALENVSRIQGAPVVLAGTDLQIEPDAILSIEAPCTVEAGTTADIGDLGLVFFDEVTLHGGTFVGPGGVDLVNTTVVDGVVSIDVLSWDVLGGPDFPVTITPSGELHVNDWAGLRQGELIVQGLLAADTLIIVEDGVTLDAPGRVEGLGDLLLWDACDLTVNPLSAGAASVASELRVEGGAIVNNGAELRLEGETVFQLEPGAMTGSGTIRQVGPLTVAESTTVTLAGCYDWDGDEAFPSTTTIHEGMTLDITADAIEDPGLFEGYDGTVIMHANATLIVDTDSPSWLHQGSLFALEGGATLAGDDILSGGKIHGSFAAQGLDIISDGLLEPTGLMHLTLGTFTLGGNNVLSVLIESSTEYGTISAITPFVNNGTVVLGGRLEICPYLLNVPQIGESFDVVVANLIEGGFDEIYAPGYEFSYHYGNPPLSNAYVRATYLGIPEDLDGDGLVNAGDLLILLAEWGPCGGACAADLDGNGVVDVADLLQMFGAWTEC